jgi:hypothetical protein
MGAKVDEVVERGPVYESSGSLSARSSVGPSVSHGEILTAQEQHSPSQNPPAD